MAKRIIWGAGYFQASESADFSDAVKVEYSTGQLHFQQVCNDYENINHSIRRIFKGWRPIINITLLNANFNTSYGLDTFNIIKLLSIINNAKQQGKGIYIRPRYDNSVNVDTFTFYCELMSDINIQDGDNASSFQKLDLEFRGINLLQTIPTGASNPQGQGWIREDEKQYIDQNGNMYNLVF